MQTDSRAGIAVVFLVTVFLLLPIIWFAPVPTAAPVQTVNYDSGTVSQPLDLGASSTGRVLFVGDLLLARDVEQKISQYGEQYPYHRIDSLFLAHEQVVANFEAAVPKVHVPTPPETLSFSVAVERLPAMREAGVTHVSLANNHSFDKGEAGYQNTLGALTSADIVAMRPGTSTRLQLVDHTISIIPLDTTTRVIAYDDLERLLITEQAETNIQVAYVHWGDEYEMMANEEQQTLAHWLIDRGVDLIVGHHPHVVQNIEIYRDVPIFYSLGNFIFDQYFSEPVQTGLTLSLDVTKVPTVTLYPVTSTDMRAAPRLHSSTKRADFLEQMAQTLPELEAGLIERGEFAIPLSLPQPTEG